MSQSPTLQSFWTGSLKCLRALLDCTNVRGPTIFSTGVSQALLLLEDFPQKMADKFEVPESSLRDWADCKNLPVSSVRAEVALFILDLVKRRLDEMEAA